ncbi:MAG TPA: tRNA (adenosine(37)-N6)-threonylcarbamoyltransferase complex dimerization subunit type 1 TsaB [Mycobacteriales bacterium]|nr:tRNA (adenosine(37)-N6)-threonylcarbamoyltransferase complex dimerization subunit type 1 TsaB [Mycobacteriales bacterium]
MLALVLDTSTPAVTAGLVDLSDLRVLAEAVEVDARRHGELLALNLRAVLEAGEPDTVVVGVGPGPFTGLRVGIVTAAAFAEARGLPVHGVCSLDGLAAPGVGVATDARRKEVYWAAYDDDAVRVDGPHVSTPERARDSLQGRQVRGDGALLYGFATEQQPRYPQVAELARAARREQLPLTPLYLRRPDAVPSR